MGELRPSLVSTESTEPMDVLHHHPVFVKDTSKFWYRPKLSREAAIRMLRESQPGTFIVRDSNSYPNAYGLALKVSTPPPGVTAKTGDGTELVRHFLIESTPKGVRLRGCNNEPIFGSLAALVYQHSITPLALPCKLVLPESEKDSWDADVSDLTSPAALLEQGAACAVLYLHSCDTESLTGPQAIRKTVDEAYRLSSEGLLHPLSVHFKVAATGVTITDNTRQRFFRRHYATSIINFCGLDPEDRKWSTTSPSGSHQDHKAHLFGFVARKVAGQSDNTCHVFAEVDPDQPASAIVNFVTKVLMGPRNNH